MIKGKTMQGLLLLTMIICPCGCSSTAHDTIHVSNEEMSANEDKGYEYPDEFELTGAIKGAIEQLAIWYGNDFEAEEAVKEDSWQDFVIATYVQGNWDGYDYLKNIEYQQDGLVTKEQLEYIQYSLTGIKVDFEAVGENDTINCLENIGSSYYGRINEYTSQCNGDNVSICAEFETSSSNGSNLRTYNLTVMLQKNPESCFDGYSIISLSKEDVTVVATGDGLEHSFKGSDMDFEAKDGTLTFELDASDDDVEYCMIIHVSATDDQKEYVKNNVGSLFRITYVLDENMQQPVERVEAKSIEIVSN